VFGVGTVISGQADSRCDEIVVLFTDARGKAVEKTLDTNFAKLEPV
jgi:hypothetical protein